MSMVNVDSGVNLSADEKQRLENRRLLEEIRKLEAEVKDLTNPSRSPRFYLSVITTMLSAIAAFAAVYGIGLQRTYHQLEQKELETGKEALKKKNDDYEKDRISLKKALDDLETEKRDLQTEKTAAERLVKQFSAFAHVLVGAPSSPRRFNPLPNSPWPAPLNRDDPLNAMVAKVEDFDYIASLLARDKDNQVRDFCAKLLSRVDLELVGNQDKQRSLAEKIIQILVAEDSNSPRRRDEAMALGRLGREAVEPILRYLRKTDKEAATMLVDALAEIPASSKKGQIQKSDVDAVVTQLLPQLSRSKDKAFRQLAAKALGAFGAADAETALWDLLPQDALELATGEDYFVAVEAITALSKVGMKDHKSAALRLVQFLDVDSGDASKYDVERTRLTSAVLRTLASIGPAAGPIASPKIQRIIDRDISMNRTSNLEMEAMYALGRVAGAESVARIVESKKDNNSDRSAQAALMSLSIGAGIEDELIPALLRVRPNVLDYFAINSLRSRGDDGMRVIAAAYRHTANVIDRQRILSAINGRPFDKSTRFVLDALDDANPNVQLAAIQFLQNAFRIAPKSLSDTEKKRIIAKSESIPSDSPARSAMLRLVDEMQPAQAISGKLNANSETVDGKLYFKHLQKLEVGRYQFDLQSEDFDAYLYVKRLGQTLAFDDDSGGNYHSRIVFRVDASGEFELGVTSFSGGQGNYTLSIRKLE